MKRKIGKTAGRSINRTKEPTCPIVVQAGVVHLLGGQEEDREEARDEEDAAAQPERHREAGPVVDKAANGRAKHGAEAKEGLSGSNDLAGMPWSCLRMIQMRIG